MTTTRPIPPEITEAEVFFLGRGSLEHSEHDYDGSEVRYHHETGEITGISLEFEAYDNWDGARGTLDFPGFPGFLGEPRPRPEMNPGLVRPIPSEPTIAETCFAENWSMESAVEIAGTDGVDVEDEDTGLVTCRFKDRSIVHFRKDFKNVFGVYLVYNIAADGNLCIPTGNA